MIESKALDEQTKMARLLKFLEGPALRAVQRYEAVPGSLAKPLEVLQNRFGQPFKIVRACIDTLTKGPAIAPRDKEGLQLCANIAQVMYEMNTDSLEKVVLIAQMASRQVSGTFEKVMPTFKDVVEFLNDRADLVNHPLIIPSGGMKIVTSRTCVTKLLLPQAALRRTVNLKKIKDALPSNCLLCTECHPLYHCEVLAYLSYTGPE